MPKVHYAVQTLNKGRPRSNPKWTTVFYHRNKTVAERVLASIRQNRLHVTEVSRLVVRVPALTAEA